MYSEAPSEIRGILVESIGIESSKCRVAVGCQLSIDKKASMVGFIDVLSDCIWFMSLKPFPPSVVLVCGMVYIYQSWVSISLSSSHLTFSSLLMRRQLAYLETLLDPAHHRR